MKAKILDIIKNYNPKSYPSQVKKDPDLHDWLVNCTNYLTTDNINERLWVLVNGAPNKNPCGKIPKFNSFIKGYHQFCGSKSLCECSRIEQSKTITKKHKMLSDEEKNKIQNKIKATSLKRYGVENPAMAAEVKEKIKKTNIERYGVEHPLQSKNIQEKIKKTNTEKYGHEYPLQSKNIQKKCHTTLSDRHGNYMKNVRQSFLEKNNNLNPFTVHRDKIKKTLNKKYGVDHPLQSDEILNNRKQREIEKHGVHNPSQRHFLPGTLNIITDKSIFNEYCKNKSFKEVQESLGIKDPKTLWSYLDFHNIEVFNRKSRSQYEEEIALWLDSIGVDYERNVTILNRKTVDFLIGNFAIEFNGLYTHSINSHYGKLLGVDKNYHYNKFKMCENADITLYTIFEDEWNLKKNSFKNKIKAELGLLKKGDPARKCSLKFIDYNDVVDFMNRYHIQGAATGSYYIGAYSPDDTLVAVMSFKKISKESYELNRFANDDKSHAGLFTKMLNFFEKSIKPLYIISFSDNRYSTGAVYQNNGFEFDSFVSPDYSVTDYKIREHKFNWRKNRIKSRFGVCIENKTEWQLTKELGFDRIYDCGKKKWIKRL